MILMSAMTSLLFLGGWLPPFQTPYLSFVPSPVWLIGKICCMLFVFLWVRATMPRYRYDQLMHLGWKVFLPISLVGVIVISALKAYGVVS
jgi:NADH-quinone oxidoreductase subunit H